MRHPPKKRIDTSGASVPLGDLGAAFVGLEISALPAAREDVAKPARVGPNWKPGRVVLRREKAQRGGKTVIVIHDFATHLPVSFIDALARRIRSACGCGGTVRGRSIEIQGDQPGKIRALLETEGFKVAGIS